jgi:hypothetical protein
VLQALGVENAAAILRPAKQIFGPLPGTSRAGAALNLLKVIAWPNIKAGRGFGVPFSERGCEGCGGSYKDCNGMVNALRRFADWSDLAAHCDEETIVRWINQLAEERQGERARAAAGFVEFSQ